jgi:predicted RNA-binding protein with PIN domain
MRYFIDGYNVIHACAPLIAIASTNIESARDALIEMSATLLKPGIQVLIVFDGQGATTDRSLALPGVDRLEAVYTAQNLSADTWIERAVYNAKKRNLCTVITADGGIRDLCRALGARVLTPEWFEAETGRSRTGGAHHSQSGTTGASRELGDRLNSESIDRLHQLRNKLGDADDSKGK